MKIKEAYRQYGGKAAMKNLCDGIAKKFGIVVIADEVVNEENPKDNYLCVYFEFKDTDSRKFEDARMEVIMALLKKGLTLSYECNGDGRLGVIMTYRVIYSI